MGDISNSLRRKLIDFFHDNNIGEYVALPEIAVMGDTSTGKSSVLSAISSVQFPSAVKITTRCPARVRMERCDERKPTKVDIRWVSTDISAEGKAKWTPKLLDDPSKITAAIKSAQDFILSLCKRNIARDTIEIHLFGPDLEDITLIDLPGFVRTFADGEDASMIADIDALVQDYLVRECCIIMPVVDLTYNWRNSSILKLAREVDPDGMRILYLSLPSLIWSSRRASPMLSTCYTAKSLSFLSNSMSLCAAARLHWTRA